MNVVERLVSMLTPSVENFSDVQGTNKVSEKRMNFTFLLSFVIVNVLLLLLGKFLWNNYLVSAVTVVKPLKDIWQLLAISVLFKLLL